MYQKALGANIKGIMWWGQCSREKVLNYYLEQVPGNNLTNKQKLAVFGASFGPEVAGGQNWRQTTRSPIGNKMLIEVNLEQMPGATGSQEDLHGAIGSASTITQQG